MPVDALGQEINIGDILVLTITKQEVPYIVTQVFHNYVVARTVKYDQSGWNENRTGRIVVCRFSVASVPTKRGIKVSPEVRFTAPAYFVRRWFVNNPDDPIWAERYRRGLTYIYDNCLNVAKPKLPKNFL